MKLKLSLTDLEFDKFDLKRKIRIPKYLTSNLAEDLGHHIGDGHMNSRFDRTKNRIRYEFDYSGHSIDDRDYYVKIFKKRKKALYNLSINIKKKRNVNAVVCKFVSKAILTFFKSLDIVCGKKTGQGVPKIIMLSNNEIKASFLRGLADADFSLTFLKKHKIRHYYPVIRHETASINLHNDVKCLLLGFGFTLSAWKLTVFDKRTNNYYKKFAIDLNGRKNLRKWMKIIGFKNYNHISKFFVWKIYGFCPAKTTVDERKRIISGFLDPNIFYGSARI